MVSLEEKLGNLGLSQYFGVLKDNGFEDWETILDITEDDLRDLGFKIGHRRILQRQIAGSRNPSTPDTCRSPTGDHASSAPSPNADASGSTPETLPAEKRTAKRRYRWHPRPDPNAPKRPKTAYVNFADHLRTNPAIANLSFVEIAREVGKQWQLMDPAMKQKWEAQAASAMQEYEEQMELYRRTDAYQEYQRYLESFKKAPGKTTRQKLRTNSSSDTVPQVDRSESVESGEGGRTRSVGSAEGSAEQLQEECQRALFRAMTELKRLRQEYTEFQSQDTTAMPPDDLARAAIGAMIEGSGSLLYVFSREQAAEVLRASYDPSSKPDSLLLTELCIMSAVGGYFDSRTISSPLIKRLAATALTFLDSVVVSDETYLRIMRILCCLTMYALLEKHLSARYCVAAALAIARWKYPQLGVDGDDIASRDSWRKVYRTLVFLECWMYYTLGYSSDSVHIHLKYTLEAVVPQDSVENAIQHQAAKLAVVAAEISRAVQQPDQMTEACMDYLIGKLDAWQHNLPVPLQLMALISSGKNKLSSAQERAMLMVHILYLGAVILLYRQLLVAADIGRDSGQLAIPEREIAKYQAACEMAAQQVARVLGVVKFDGYCTLRCWLITYWSFSACVVLLYRAAQSLRDGKLLSVDDQLSFSTTCIQMLRVCSNEEPIAARYLAMLEPAFETLQEIRQKLDTEIERGKRSSQPKLSISALLESSPSPTPASTPQGARSSSPQLLKADPVLREDASKIVARMGILLKDPFGRLQQSGELTSVEVPYPSPPLSETTFWFR